MLRFTALFLRGPALILALVGPMSAPFAQEDERSVPPAGNFADETPHSLEIRDGALWLDGRMLPESAVPDELDLAGLQMSVEYSGPVTPVVEVDGVAYVLQEERLVRFDESERAGSQVYFLGEAAQAEPAAPAEPSATLTGGVAPGRARRDDAHLRRAGEEAYMQDLSTTDRELYDQIRREAELDAESNRLAEEIRGTADPAARAAGVDRLRSILAEAFDLKQQIREAEIERAEAQVVELRRMLGARGARKAMVVEHRLRELIGE